MIGILYFENIFTIFILFLQLVQLWLLGDLLVGSWAHLRSPSLLILLLYFKHFLTCLHYKIFQVILYILIFSWFLLLENDIRSQDLSVRCTHCYCLVYSLPVQLKVQRNIYVCTNPCHIRISISLYVTIHISFRLTMSPFCYPH